MGLNWSDLRVLQGSQEQGFEELCSQLARLETPAGAEFVRKGSPDGGVECFCRLEDGQEWGWQAKFFRSALRDSQWSQLDRSVRAALDAHPCLTRYVVCVPRERSDSRKAGVTTEMQRWEAHVTKWQGWATERGMAVEFVWWGSSRITSLLAHDRQAGRVRFWFGGAGRFSDEWFDKQLERAVNAAGPRYTPEIHVDVPVVKDFERFGRSEPAVAAVRRLAKRMRKQPVSVLRRHVGEDAVNAIAVLGGVDESVTKVAEALLGASCPPHEKWRLSDITSAIDDALGRLDACEAPLGVAAEGHDEQQGRTADGSRGYVSNPYREAARQVEDLQAALWRTSDTLNGLERAVNSDLMIVKGDAGVGKTHLLCDIARKRLADGRPTVVLMGHQFTTTQPPWQQILAQLDLAGLSAEQFVGALETAAQAAGCRALLMIDAINEGEGHRIWRNHLSDLLTHVAAFPWVGVVLSVRTMHFDRIVPRDVCASAYVVTHHGFTDDTYAAVERFCEHYDLEFPTTPLLQAPSSTIPCSSRRCAKGCTIAVCEGIPVGSEGISTVFGRFIDAVDEALSTELDYDPLDQVVPRALEAVAATLADTAARALPTLAGTGARQFVRSNQRDSAARCIERL